MKNFLYCGAVSVFCLVCIPVFSFASNAAVENIPFRPGEKLHFKVYWTTILAAEVTVEVLPIEQIAHEPAYHFAMTARTVPALDTIYRVRDRMESFAHKDMSHALLYKVKKEGDRKKDVYVAYDTKKLEARLVKNGKKRRPVRILPGSFDPLSVFYFFRMQQLQEGSEISAPVSDGKTCMVGKARVLRRERIQVSGRSYDTYLVEPDLGGIRGVFQKTPNAKLQIWVTADNRKLPVMIKSEVAVGSFTAELDGTN